ncbi:unnamed protein product, partial [Mesorhabditis spiculigera]
MAASSRSSSTPGATNKTKHALPVQTPNFVLGMLIQVARRILFVNVRLKAAAHFLGVILLSIVSHYVMTTDEHLLEMKFSYFNQYGVKLGWFWTCAVVGPYIWYSSKLHHKDGDRVWVDMLRLGMATLMWYTHLHVFHWIRESTSRCDKSVRFSRDECSTNGGVWIPGHDFSGHCFLLIYSILIVSEEASSYRQWQQLDAGVGPTARKQFAFDSLIAQVFFVLMCVLHICWDFQLLRSCIYYHTFLDKFVGAAGGVFAWAFTYRFLYPNGFLCMPIHRRKAD